MTLNIPDSMVKRLIEHIDGGNYCFLCDHHPRKDHTGHDKDCPLYVKPSPEPEEPQKG